MAYKNKNLNDWNISSRLMLTVYKYTTHEWRVGVDFNIILLL